ncbi:MAG: orotidine-5'-phosphate decarboxylase [Mycoplasmoidaceae bacterium]
MDQKITDKIIIALDYQDFKDAKDLIDLLDDEISIYKVGLEAFLNYGTDLINYLKWKEKKIFFDLKFNDITNTVLQACKYALEQKFFIFTVHCSVGNQTLKELKKLLINYDYEFHIALVTILTNLNQSDYEITFQKNSLISDHIKSYVQELIINNGYSTIVCSPLEAKKIKVLFKNLTIICPGIRMNEVNHDQIQISTPSQALNNGADYLVIGREITLSNDPRKKLELVKKDIYENYFKKLPIN